MTAGAVSLDNAGLGFGLVVAAGLSTGVGAAAVFVRRFVKLASTPVLAAGLGFSGGVMLYVSFVEIFVKSQDAFKEHGLQEKDAYFLATLCLFAGMLLLRVIAFLVHKIDKNHHHHGACDVQTANPAGEAALEVDVQDQVAPADLAPVEAPQAAAAAKQEGAEKATSPEVGAALETAKAAKDRKELQMMGLNTAIAIAIHNFPEGLATFVGTLADPAVGATLAVAIAIHNIPEGLCVALPIYYSTQSRMKGFLWALLSGLSEPVGALIGWAIIKSTGDDMNQLVYGILFGLVSGMMIMIVILELLPTAYKYDPTDRFVTSSVVAGMAVMALSLCLFLA